MIGSTILHYRIREELGRGGMGAVYKAEDLRLGRLVALKFLPPEFRSDDVARKRFLREAQAASVLAHPNICVIHGIEEFEGDPFIVMEFVEGMTLEEKARSTPPDVPQVISWAHQILTGLAFAHSKGIVHRDIKPRNIMIRDDGRVQIMDFGLAVQHGASRLSTAGQILGTVSYMPPEQVGGGDVDARADLYACGVVLYELLTGRLPFSGAHEAAVLYEIINVEPPSILSLRPDLPPPLDYAVMKCLEKSPVKRFQSAEDLATALTSLDLQVPPVSVPPRKEPEPRDTNARTLKPERRGWRRYGIALAAVILVGIATWWMISLLGGNNNQIRSLAILPLKNEASDSGLVYLSDGLTESIINKLSGQATMKVMSWNAVSHYKDRNVDPQAVGKTLGVRAVLAGQLMLHEDVVEVHVELLDTRDNTEIWGDQFIRKQEQLFALQEDVAKDIVARMRLRLTSEETARIGQTQTDNAEAYQLYLKGRYYWNRRTEKDLKESIRYFEEAITLDPRYAQAYSGLASVYIVMTSWDIIDPEEGVKMAEGNVRKALELDDKLGEAYSIRAGLKDFSYDRLGALEDYKKSIELNPNDGTLYQWYAEALAGLRRFDDSFVMIRRARELDPLSLMVTAVAAVFSANDRRFDEAIEYGKQTNAMDPHASLGYLALGLAYTRAGQGDRAIAPLEHGVALSDSEETLLSWLGCAYAEAGRNAEARRVADILDRKAKDRFVSPFLRALVYTTLGDHEKAIALLREGVRKHDGWMGQTYEEIMLDPLRSDPRYTEIVRSLGLMQ